MTKIGKFTLCQLTMEAGKGIEGSVLQWNLKNNAHLFDQVIVVDGNLTNEAIEFYEQFDNIEYINSPWEDNYVKQYQAWYDKLDNKDIFLYLDDDEIVKNFKRNWIEDYFKFEDVDIIRMPCVLHITEDNKKYYAAEKQPELKYNGQWIKNILGMKSDNLYFWHGGSHVVANTKRQHHYGYSFQEYCHMKSLESFVYNDVLQAFLAPLYQQFSLTDARLFEMFTSCYKSTKEVKNALKKGTWPAPLKKFAWERRREYNNPVSRLAWAYYILEGHPMPENDSFMRWDNVKEYVIDLSIYKENKKRNENFLEIK